MKSLTFYIKCNKNKTNLKNSISKMLVPVWKINV